MNSSKELGRGLSAYTQAHKVIFKYNLTKYLILPGLISLAYCVGFFLLFFSLSSGVGTDAADYPWWLSWMGGFLSWFVWIVYWAFIIWLFFATFKYAIQPILSPLLANLSERVEKTIQGRPAPDLSWKEFFQDIVRGLQLTFRNLFYEILLCIGAGFIPLVGFLVVFGISAFYTGFGYMDYTLERKRYSVKQSIQFAKKHKSLTIGLGIPISLAMFIPIIGWMVAPSYATVASTLAIMDMFGDKPGTTSGSSPFNERA